MSETFGLRVAGHWRQPALVLLACFALSACGRGPFARVQDEPAIEAAAVEGVETAAAVDVADAGAAETADDGSAEVAVADAAADTGETTVFVRSTRPRLLGFLFQRTPGDVGESRRAALSAAVESGETDARDVDADIVTVAADADAGGEAAGNADPVDGVEVAALDTEDRPRGWRGFLRRIRPGGGGDRGEQRLRADVLAPETTVGAGAALAFGELARVCDLPRSTLGKVVDRSPAGFRLHDTAPDSIEPRTLYITGFRDGCARQLTASLALFGSAAVHEATRYNPLNEAPYSLTDESYEQVKSRICRVGHGEPCPERRLRRLERKSAFISVYRGFGDSGLWMEIFMHNGEVASHELRSG